VAIGIVTPGAGKTVPRA